MRYRIAFLLASLVGAVAVAIMLLQHAHLSFRDPGLHVAIQTSIILIGGVVGLVALGRYRRLHDRADILVAGAVGLLAVADLAFSDLPAVVIGDRAGRFSTWMPLGVRAIAAALLVGAAFVRKRHHVAGLPSPLSWVAGAAVLVGLLAGVATGWLPDGQELAPGGSSIDWSASALMISSDAAVALLLFAAGIGFLAHAERRGDDFTGFLAAGCALATAWCAGSALTVSGGPAWVDPGELLQTGAFLCWLVGSAREVVRSEAALAVAEERRRIARDIHDGVAQELSFIVTKASRPNIAANPLVLLQIQNAAQRGLDESRRAIAELARRVDEPLGTAVARTAEEVAGRYEMEVDLQVDQGLSVPAAVKEAMVWIVREAVTNAGRHGAAHRVAIALGAGSPVRLCVGDDGVGFDPRDPATVSHGFGLTSIQERAATIGTTVQIRSRPGGGTTLEVM